MTKLNIFLKRSAIGSLVVLQIFFYPSVSFAATTDTIPEETSPAAVAEAAPQPNSEATPDTNSDQPADSSTAAIEEPGNDSETGVTNETTTDTDITDVTDIAVTNDIDSTAQSGDANANQNYENGTATTGNAAAIANLINMLQSQSSAFGNGNMYTFSADIHGSVVGDLLIDPSTMNTIQNTDLSNTDIEIINNGSITNNVDLSAVSGNANANGNYENGSATSGSANAVANIVNVMNTIISSGGSFLGNINIYGDLEGDILLPPNLLAQVLATNSIPTATISIDTSDTTNINLENNTSIDNNIATSAQSGAANANNNLGNGTAQTGNGTTEITVLNLTGRQIIGANSLLVFVNVQGEWVGVIMDAPTGTTAAALGGGIVSSTNAQNTNIDITNNSQITNNVNVNAQSGNANANNNYGNGSATSGNASASANIANMANNQFTLSNWFGILFINVFGSWHGSFGVDTAMGGIGGQQPNSPAPAAPAPVFQFVASDGSTPDSQRYHLKPASFTGASTTTGMPIVNESGVDTQTTGVTLSKATDTAPAAPVVTAAKINSSESKSSSWAFTAIGLGLAGSLLIGERVISAIQRRKL